MDIRSCYPHSKIVKRQHEDTKDTAKEQPHQENLPARPLKEDFSFVWDGSMENDATSSDGEVLEDKPLPLINRSDGRQTSQPSGLSYGVICSYSGEVTDEASVSCANHKAPGPSDLGQCLTEGPRQPILKEYPLKKMGVRFRSFRAQWFQTYKWLEYSVSKDAAYCFPCRLFSMYQSSSFYPGSGGLKHNTFVTVGFTNWKHALGNVKGISLHDKSASHKKANERWEDFKRHINKELSVMKDLNEAYAKEIKENRHYIKTIAKIIRLTIKTKIAQGESCFSSDDLDHGHIREILYLIAENDSTVKEKLNEPQNAHYLHPSIKNELVSVMAALVREDIAHSLKNSPFSILGEEVNDLSEMKQLCVVVRYVHNKTVNESFFKCYKADCLDADSLINNIFTGFSSLGIDKNKCVGQAYEGGSVMSGQLHGVQSQVHKKVPQALYIHCMNHNLNLVIVDTVKNVQMAAEFFVKLQKLYVFCSSPVVHSLFMTVQKRTSKSQVILLKQLSDTGCIFQHSAFKAVLLTLEALLETLNLLAEGRNAERAIEANAIRQTINFNFILALVVFEDILKRTQTLSDMLQATDPDLGSAVLLAQTVIHELEEIRNESWEIASSTQPRATYKIWEETLLLSAKCGIAAPSNEDDAPSHKKRAYHMPLYLCDSIIMETVKRRPQLSKKEDFRTHFVHVVLDRILKELKLRFSVDSLQIMEAVQALNPRSQSFLSVEKLLPMATYYCCNLDDLTVEIKQALQTLERKKTSDSSEMRTILEFTNFLKPYAVPFFELYRLCKIACVLPVSSASRERSFSAQKITKSYLRKAITGETLSDLGTLATEFKLAAQLSMDTLIERFAEIHNNSIINLY